MPDALVRLTGVQRTFAGGRSAAGLLGVDLVLERGSQTAVTGRSGSGKSTLLNVLGCLDRPTAGTYELDGIDVATLDDAARTALRRDRVGFVFQAFHLIPTLDARDNVALGLLYRGVPHAEALRRADAVLERVGLGGRGDESVRTYSGGEQQRVAIARALVGQPELLLADEPTGNLDSHTAAAVLDLLIDSARTAGATLVVVTHDPAVAARLERIVTLVDGRATSMSGEAARSPASAPPRRPAVSRRALASDAWRSLQARRRTLLIGAGAVLLAVGLVVASLGLQQGARSQVASVFDARAAQQVHADIEIATEHGPPRFADVDLDRFAGLAGVRAAGAIEVWDGVAITNGPSTIAQGQVGVVSGDALPATRAELTWAPGHHDLGAGEAIVGEALAARLGLGHLARAPELLLDGRPYVAVAVLHGSTQPTLLGAVLTTSYRTDRRSSFGFVDARTVPGAARQVARQAAVALDPYRPDRIVVAPVPDPNALRGELEGSVSAVLVALTAVSVLAAIATLVSTMALVVSSRRVELGLRRALGARQRDLVWQVAVESAITGLLGGATGLFSAFVGLQLAFAAQGWRPVFDLRLAPLALVLGVVVGTVAGLVPAVAAARVDPIVALRGVERA